MWRQHIFYIFSIIAGLSVQACNALKPPVQEDSTTAPETISQQLFSEPVTELSPFILPGYEVRFKSVGDLNVDGLEDVALVLALRDEYNEKHGDHGPNRPLLLLTRQTNGSLFLQSRNDLAVRCFYCGGPMGEPYEDMIISDGMLKIYHSGGSNSRWAITTQYTYDNVRNDWFLAKTSKWIGELIHASGLETTGKIEIKTSKDFGDVRFSDHNIYDVL